MTNEQMKTLASLSSDGYAVIVWTPEELGDVSARLIEDQSIELGHQIIEDQTDSCGILEMADDQLFQEIKELIFKDRES